MTPVQCDWIHPALLTVVVILAVGAGALFGFIVGRIGQRAEDARRAEAVARREGWKR